MPKLDTLTEPNRHEPGRLRLLFPPRPAIHNPFDGPLNRFLSNVQPVCRLLFLFCILQRIDTPKVSQILKHFLLFFYRWWTLDLRSKVAFMELHQLHDWLRLDLDIPLSIQLRCY